MSPCHSEVIEKSGSNPGNPGSNPGIPEDSPWLSSFKGEKWTATINGFPLQIEHTPYDLSGKGLRWRVRTNYTNAMFAHQFYTTADEAKKSAEAAVKAQARGRALEPEKEGNPGSNPGTAPTGISIPVRLILKNRSLRALLIQAGRLEKRMSKGQTQQLRDILAQVVQEVLKP